MLSDSLGSGICNLSLCTCLRTTSDLNKLLEAATKEPGWLSRRTLDDIEMNTVVSQSLNGGLLSVCFVTRTVLHTQSAKRKISHSPWELIIQLARCCVGPCNKEKDTVAYIDIK